MMGLKKPVFKPHIIPSFHMVQKEMVAKKM
jgi:hypothetical protein